MRTGTTVVGLVIAIMSGSCAAPDAGVRPVGFARKPLPSSAFHPALEAGYAGPRRPAPVVKPIGVAPAITQAQAAYAVLEPPPLPPAPRRDMMAAKPAREAVWIKGYHAYMGGGRYAWVPGHWEVPPGGGRTFHPPAWQQRGNGYVYIPGGWR